MRSRTCAVSSCLVVISSLTKASGTTEHITIIILTIVISHCRMLGSVGEFPCLKLLDVSGLHKITAAGLDSFLHMCPNLRPDMLSYCDDIMDGPFSDVANGCQNVDSSKICCRNL